jgi:hypothetical protein
MSYYSHHVTLDTATRALAMHQYFTTIFKCDYCFKSSVLATIMESIEIEELFASCESIGFVFVELC